MRHGPGVVKALTRPQNFGDYRRGSPGRPPTNGLDVQRLHHRWLDGGHPVRARLGRRRRERRQAGGDEADGRGG